MPATRKRQRKNGSVYYEISVSRGYGKSAYTMRWDAPEGLSAKTIKARLQQAAYEFEQDCRAGKVKTRGERKEEERQAAMRRALEAKDRMTVQRFCDETFLPDLRLRCSENTAYNYRLQLEKHIYPDIGQIELSEMKSGDINELLRKYQMSSASLSTAIKVYTIVRAVMKMAYKDELIDRNPMDRVDRPRRYKDSGTPQNPMACTVEELQRLRKALKTEPLLWQTLVRLLIDSGMRVGECVGLLWRNVDFEGNTITVDGTMVYSPDTPLSKSGIFGLLQRIQYQRSMMVSSNRSFRKYTSKSILKSSKNLAFTIFIRLLMMRLRALCAPKAALSGLAKTMTAML